VAQSWMTVLRMKLVQIRLLAEQVEQR
jgi:hypothetical protein